MSIERGNSPVAAKGVTGDSGWCALRFILAGSLLVEAAVKLFQLGDLLRLILFIA